MPPAQVAILKAIVKHGPVKYYELEDLSGYASGTCHIAVARFKKLGLIRPEFGFPYEATEKGKIILAILMGKETKRRSHAGAAKAVASNAGR